MKNCLRIRAVTRQQLDTEYGEFNPTLRRRRHVKFSCCFDYVMCQTKEILRTRVGTLIVATNYLQLIQNRYMFRSFTVLQCSHQHCAQPVASDVEVVVYL